jgi:diguanylate cyclase (GGDEF)-like protein/PAS domain S-box-containing protein
MLVYGGAMTLFLLLAVMIRFVFAAAMANHRFIQLIEQAPIPYLLLDGYKQVRFTNPAFTESYGYTWDDLTSMSSWWQITSLPKTNIELFQEHIKELQVGRSFSQSAIPFEVELKTRSGQSKFALITASFISNSLENEMLLVVYDITSRKEAEEQLRFSSRVFNQAHEGILITDTQGIITDSNPAFSDITGFEREEIIGRKPNLFRSGRHPENFYQDMWHSLNEHGYWYGEVWNLRKDNQIYAALLTISALKDDDGTTRHYVGLYTDITQAKRQQDELELLAHYDLLTKLPNRALFADRFVQAVAFSRRHDKMVGICFLDLDNFKPVNDRYGHDVGDYVLIEVAKRLKTIIRDEDTISRLGGDEFVILFCEIESKTQCEALMDRIHSALSEPYQYEDKEFSISASSGVTFYPEDDADLDTLLRHADHAMYQSKLLGRNTFTFFNPEEDEAKVEKVRELQQLQEALKADQFVLYYQPKVNMASGEVFGMEALIRWQHPERGVLTPYHFLPLMSDTYLEPHFGVWVMQQAVAQAHVWHQQGHKLEVSINISSYHLKSETFISDLAAVLAAYPDFEPQYLQLEILETSALGNVYEISDIIKQCRETLGVSIALDDFGTGYSALSHLRHLTASTVKIDQSFVRDMLDDPQDYNIVDGVTKLAKAFDIGVIAEGVETIEHGLLLLMTGCQLAQGYVIARPMPADEVATWIQHYRPLLRWMEASHDVTSPQQRIIIIFELIAQRLFNQVAEIILSERELPPTWPHFTSNNCPCYLWLERVRGMEIFDRAWIDKLAILHSQWMTEATAVKVAFESGQTDQENFERFQQAYEALSGLLSSAKSSWKHSSYPSIASSVNDEPL